MLVTCIFFSSRVVSVIFKECLCDKTKAVRIMMALKACITMTHFQKLFVGGRTSNSCRAQPWGAINM